MLRRCSFNQDAVPCHPWLAKMVCSFQPRSFAIQASGLLTTTSTPPLTLCNSTCDALRASCYRSAPPPLSLCSSTHVALHLHPLSLCTSTAPPPLSLCTSYPCRSATPGAPPLAFGMLHGHTSSSCILSTFAIRAATAADCKWLRWPWRSLTPQCFGFD